MAEIPRKAPEYLEQLVQFKNVLEQLGGVPLGPDHFERYTHIATLPTIDDLTRFFPLDNQNIRKHHLSSEDVYMTSFAEGFLFIKIVGKNLIITPIDAESAGWNTTEAEKGLVYGFPEKPKQFDRAERILRQHRLNNGKYDSILIPLDDPQNHNKIRLTQSQIDDS